MISTKQLHFSRIAHQQEQVRKFSNQPHSKAIPAPRKSITKPIDLTTTLLQSNLSQLAKPLPSSASHPTRHAAPIANPTYSTPSMASNYSYQSQFAGFDTLSTSSAGPANFNNKWANNQNQNKAKQDWSAFESLLPMANNNPTPSSDVKKLTDNEMMDLLS